MRLYPTKRRACRLLAILAIGIVLLPAQALAATRGAGRLIAWHSLVESKRREDYAFTTLARRGPFYENSVIRTDPNGKARLDFNDGTVLTLNANTVLQILPAAARKDRSVLFSLEQGTVFASLPSGYILPGHYRTCRMPGGEIRITGTEIALSVAEDGTSTLTVVEGSALFSNPYGTEVVRASQRSTARVGRAPTKPVAVNLGGELAWTADVAVLPIDFETPFLSPDPGALRALRREREAQAQRRRDSPEAQYALGAVLHDLGEYPAASLAFQKAVDLRPDAASYAGLGRARLGQGDTAGALEAFHEALRRAPQGAEAEAARVGLALAYLARGNPMQARAELDLAGAGALAQAARGLIELYRPGGDSAAAVEHLQSALKREPRLYQAQALLALAYLTRNELAQAEQAARAAVRLQPSSAQAQGTLAMVLFFARQPREATAAARRAVALNPFSPFAQLTEGRVFLSQQRTDEARAAYQRAAALAPNLWIVHAELGAVYLRLDQVQRAEESYRRALELNPRSAEAHTGLGVVLQQRGRFDEAEAEHRRALALEPGSVTARGNLAALFIERGRLQEARDLLEQGIVAAPDRGILYARMAELSLYRQDLWAAQEFARRAVSLLPNSAIAHYQLGRVYLEQERLLQAEQEFRQAATLDPQFAEARFALGFTRERVETGRTILRPFAPSGFSALSAAAGALSLNLQTPGAEERIQAALLDPTVVRVASRSYGDTQLDGLLGELETRGLDLSHLRESRDRRGLLGLTGQHLHADGVEANTDVTSERASVVYGQKAKNGPSGLFLLGELERNDISMDIPVDTDEEDEDMDTAGDTEEDSDPSTVELRASGRKPLLLLGLLRQPDERHRTRTLLQYSQPHFKITRAGDVLDVRLRSLNAEVRHDVQLGDRHWLSAGISAGTRRIDTDDLVDDRQRFVKTIGRAYQAYLRDEWRVGERLTLTGEVQLQRFHQERTVRRPSNPEPTITPEAATEWLPNLVVAYQPDARTGLRFRARRLFGAISDFQLLTPTDVFLFSLADLPEVRLRGRGRSLELEYDYTFANASFVRLGLFHQRLEEAPDARGNRVRIRQRGLRATYEGILSRNATFFVGVNLNRAKYPATDQEVLEVPRWTAEAGLQYLDRRGWFVQPSFFYLGRRMQETEEAVVRAGGFSLFSVRAGKRWGLRSTVFLEIRNVFDKRYAILGELQPESQLRFGATQRF